MRDFVSTFKQRPKTNRTLCLLREGNRRIKKKKKKSISIHSVKLNFSSPNESLLTRLSFPLLYIARAIGAISVRDHRIHGSDTIDRTRNALRHYQKKGNNKKEKKKNKETRNKKRKTRSLRLARIRHSLLDLSTPILYL